MVKAANLTSLEVKTEDWNVMFHMQSEKMNILKVICY